MGLDLSKKAKRNYLFCGLGTILKYFDSQGEVVYSKELLDAFMADSREKHLSGEMKRAASFAIASLLVFVNSYCPAFPIYFAYHPRKEKPHMTESTKNLCAPIPESLHRQLRERREGSGQTLGQYMTWLITKFYESEGKITMKEDQRTVAFQVSAELFEQFKDYLKRKGIKQNAFFLNCIRQALEEERQSE